MSSVTRVRLRGIKCEICEKEKKIHDNLTGVGIKIWNDEI